ncbi:MAG: tRNA pseudouridine(13) synthase TruD [Campylobacterota bacterium]|nr:tRNA pseudouridine(13) synthase TruD [Campylobacterota bacterium]
MITQRIYLQNHKPINFTFNQNRYDFIVDEIAAFKFSGGGNFMILRIKKVFTSTWELISIISKTLGIDEHLIGYAGLKDKNATTTQYISIPLNKSRDYKLLESKNIKVLETYRHHSKLKIGDLEGNRFKITLKDVDVNDLPVIYQTISQIQKHGMPNYFGYQRFGKENNFQKAKDIVYGDEILRDKKLDTFLRTAYQSYFFNAWLVSRVELSKEQGLKKLLVLDGDIFQDKEKKIITGLMPGRKVNRSKSKASEIESNFDDPFIHDKGFRRAAWIKPQNIKNKFIPKDDSKKNWLEIEFTLPKSSYATVFIENIANKNYSH